MHSVTCNYISLKCYINLFTFIYIVSNERRGLIALARAIDYFSSIFNLIKKFYKFNFFTITCTLPSLSFSRLHTILSPLLMFNSVQISLGIVHLNESEWGAA